MAPDDNLSKREKASIRAGFYAIEHNNIDFVSVDLAVQPLEGYYESEIQTSLEKKKQS